MKKRLTTLAVAGALLAATLMSTQHAARADALPTRLLTCGQTWGNDPGEKSFRLGNNLVCTQTALVVIGDDITIDLGGHRISSAGLSNGITICCGSNNITLRNGVIAGTDFGVIVDSSNNVRIQDIVVVDTNNAGIHVFGGRNNKVVGNILVDARSLNVANTSDSTITGNVLSRTQLTVNADSNTISGNRVYAPADPGIRLSGDSERNVVSGNAVFGSAGAGIGVIGDEADDNVVRSNVSRGNATAGVLIDAADRTKIKKNTVTGNGVGIAVQGSATGTAMSGNNASANATRGINVTSSGNNGPISENRANENGGEGIVVVLGASPVVKDNVANFNGYDDGLDNNSSAGAIVATNATGGGNKVKGNDVSGPQCISNDTNLCVVGPPDPPPLMTCDSPIITAASTLRHPLTCSTKTAIRVAGSGYTLNLGPHIVDGGSSLADEAALQVQHTASDVTIVGGVMTGSEDGVQFAVPASGGAHDITVKRALIVRNDRVGVRIQGEDATPDDATVTAGRNRIERSVIAGNGTHAVEILDAPRNAVASSVLAANGDSGIVNLRSQRNTFDLNLVTGNDSAVLLHNDSTARIPFRNKIRANRLVGNRATGIELHNGVETTVSSNLVRGNGLTSTAAIELNGSTSGGGPGGAKDNVLTENTIVGNLEGVILSADSSGNNIEANKVNANGMNGIALFNDAEDNIVRDNVANENSADDFGLVAGGILVFEPVDDDEVSDVVSGNTANRNGFLIADDNGFGIVAADDTLGSGNTAKGNDDPDQCLPISFC